MFPSYLREAGYYTTNNSKKDYNAVKNEGVWDESSRKASWRNRRPGQPFFHIQNFGVTHESSLHFTGGPHREERPGPVPGHEDIATAAYLPDTPTVPLHPRPVPRPPPR